jgi:hypothetical protein
MTLVFPRSYRETIGRRCPADKAVTGERGQPVGLNLQQKPPSSDAAAKVKSIKTKPSEVKLLNPQPKPSAKQIGATKIKRPKPADATLGGTSQTAPFMPGGATVSSVVSGTGQVKGSTGSDGTGSKGGIKPSSGK